MNKEYDYSKQPGYVAFSGSNNTWKLAGSSNTVSFDNNSFQRGQEMGAYSIVEQPKHLYRAEYQNSSWIYTAPHVQTDLSDCFIATGDPVQVLQFTIKMQQKYGMNLPGVSELKFLWNVFISKANEVPGT